MPKRPKAKPVLYVVEEKVNGKWRPVTEASRHTTLARLSIAPETRKWFESLGRRVSKYVRRGR